MIEHDFFLGFGVALAAGLLIGFEREQSAPDDDIERRRTFAGGARTYPIVSLAGALSAALATHYGWAILVMGFIGVLAFVLVNYIDSVRADTGRGITSEVAFIATYLLGAMSTAPIIEPLGRRAIIVLAVAVAVTLLLSAKPPLHKIADRASKDDVFATLKFLVVAVVILPLLPNRPMGPLDILNPFKIGLFVVLIAGVDFVGYVAMRVLGPGRGLGITGLVGGLASSTAVTLSAANRAKHEKRLTDSFALAAVIASSIMVPRVLLVAAVSHGPLVSGLAIPLAAMAVGGGVATYVLYRRSRDSEKPGGKELEIRNPFELGSALKWGLIFTVVLFVSKLAHEKLGGRGTYLAAALGGTTDVDVIILSMASLAKEGTLETRVAVTAILIGIASNSVVKAAMATVVGGVGFGKRVALALGLMIACGAAGMLAVWAG